MELVSLPIDAGDRLEQSLGVGMLRISKEIKDGGFFHNLPCIHYDDAVAKRGDNT